MYPPCLLPTPWSFPLTITFHSYWREKSVKALKIFVCLSYSGVCSGELGATSEGKGDSGGLHGGNENKARLVKLYEPKRASRSRRKNGATVNERSRREGEHQA